MTAVRTLRSGALTRVLMLAVSAALVPLPSAAAEESASARSSEAQPSISAVLARELPMPGARAGTLDPSSNGEVPLSRVIARDLVPARSSSNARRSDQGSSAADSPAFFKTPTGAVVLAVMVVGTAYAIYSAQHDRITSPGKN